MNRRKVILASLALLLLLPMATMILVATEGGSRWLLELGSRMAGDSVSFEHVSGTLLSPLELAQVELQQNGQHVSIDRLELQWRPSGLLKGTFHVQRLALKQVFYEAQADDERIAKPDKLPGDVGLPITVQADMVSIEHLEVVQGESRNQVAHLQIRDLRADRDALSFADLEVKGKAFTASARARVASLAPHTVEATVAWSYRLSEGTVANGRGEIYGDLTTLGITHRLEAPFSATLAGTVMPLGSPPRADLRLQWRGLRWPLQGPEEWRSATGNIRLQGGADLLRLMLDASVSRDGLPLNRIRVDADGGMRDDKIKAEFRWSAGLVQGGEAAGQGSVTGNTAQVALEHQLETPVRVFTRGDIALDGDIVKLSLDGDWQDLRWPLTGNPEISSASGRYRLVGPLGRLQFGIEGTLRSPTARIARAKVTLQGHAATSAPFAFDADIDWDASFESAIDAAGRARVVGNAHRIEIEKFIEQPFTLETRGEVILNAGIPMLNLEGNWRDIRWPLSGAPDYVSERGRFALQGPADKVDLMLRGDFGGTSVPPAQARLDARLLPSGATIRSLRIGTLGGEIRARGDVGWSPDPTWRLNVNASRLNPESFAPDWPGEMSLDAILSGGIQGGEPRLRIDMNALNGRLRGHVVRGSGSVNIDRASVSARNFTLHAGENSLQIEGEASNDLDIVFLIDAPSLNAFAPQLDGSLKGNGALTGTRRQPRISADLSGAGVAWGTYRMQTLTLKLDAGADPGYRSNVALDARGLRLGESPIEHLLVDGDGTPEKHRLRVKAVAPAGTLTATAEGSLVDEKWDAKVDADVSSKHFGDWRLEQSAALHVSRERASVEHTCLVQQSATVCAGGEWRVTNGAISARGEILSLPLGITKPFLPEGVDVDGPLMGEFSLDGRADAPEATARIAAEKGTIAYQPDPDFPRTEFRIRDASLEGRHLPSGTQMRLGVVLEDAGTLKGNLDIGTAGADGAAALRGRVDAEFSDLAWLGILSPRASDIRGELKAGLAIDGTTSRPSATGEATLQGGQVNLPDLGLALRQIDIRLRNQTANHYVIEGALVSGDGRVDFVGQSNLQASGRQQFELSLKGQNFEVARLPTVHAYASPDLLLRGDSRLAELTGHVHIPKATIKLKQLPESAVAVSGDEVIVGKDTSNIERSGPRGPRTRVRVDVTLGDDVSFEGFGLYAGLDGSLALSGESGQLPNAQGVLSVNDGRYDAFGQKLDIQRGRLLFTGPIDNPGIDVNAVRRAGDVTAGIAITGNVRSIKSRVYSDPPLPEADAFSYLLTGRPLSGGTKSDAAMLSGAALSLGLQRSELITSQIGATLGLDELSVGGDDVAQSSLLLGKQITPDIFVRYALGIFEQSGKLLLNYRLTESLSLEAESGEQQGVDIIYQIQRDKLF